MSDGKDVPWVLAAKTGKIGFANRLGRGDRSPLGVWFWELDRVLLSLMMVLIAIGLLAVAAASPAGAQRLSASTSQLSSLYFFYRQLMWVIVGVPIMLFISMCPREKAPTHCRLWFLHCVRAACARACIRARSEWIAPLDWPQFCGASAIGIPKALLRRYDGMDYQLAVERPDSASPDYQQHCYRCCLYLPFDATRPWPDDIVHGHMVCIDDGRWRSCKPSLGPYHQRHHLHRAGL